MVDSQPANEEQGFQILVLFEEFPEIDVKRLGAHIDSLPAAVAACDLTDFKLSTPQKNGKRYSFGTAFVDRLNVAVITHEWPLPKESQDITIGMSHWSAETKEMLASHKSYSLCTCVGKGEPIDRILALYKIGLALIDQGAIAVANEHNWTCFPAEVFEALKLPGMWEGIRNEGSPADFLVGFGKFVVDGERWVLSKGHSLFGLPEIAFKVTDSTQLEKIHGIFKTIFCYLYENGPVIEAGHTMEIDDGTFMSFFAPTEDQEFLQSPFGTLIIELESD